MPLKPARCENCHKEIRIGREEGVFCITVTVEEVMDWCACCGHVRRAERKYIFCSQACLEEYLAKRQL